MLNESVYFLTVGYNVRNFLINIFIAEICIWFSSELIELQSANNILLSRKGFVGVFA